MRRIALVLGLGLGLIGCGDESHIDTGSIIDATVRVRADGCGPRTELGTGTSIGDGVIVTAAHVVAGAARVEVIGADGETTPAEVVWFDPGLDVAALRPAIAPDVAVVLRDRRADEGDVGVIATPTDDGSIEVRDVEVVQRVTILTTDIYREVDVRRPGLRITATVEPGDSGAMVHLADGGVGIVWSRSTERADRAWTVDLPEPLMRATSRTALVEPVDTGPCP